MNASRIEVSWRPPMPDALPGMRHDPGGYIYRIFSNGKLVGSGSGKDKAIAGHAAALAARRDLHDLPVVFLSTGND